ncbi:TRAP transporter substrate-binding protein [Roseibium suaedae]|uniref:Tripartite ATP-independent transporter solute receptor, DctP family n=1 Tax=Roseibium suaedae TaxID=735517 RepID=A0A1M7HD82_9HYPH|nr:TRAP transporter substrate-binding protein [Roseibium suaedae]SHM26512.1 tripartite ATP-independent transporter solute receptor, DctP family [Roseibium suaedae]
MMKLSRLGALAATAFLTATVSAQAVTLKLNHNNPPDHPVHIAMQMMADRLAELTNGEVKIRIYPNGQLGTQRESMELVQNCSLEMARSNASELEAFEESYSALNLPYIFQSEEHFNKVVSGPIGEEILNSSVAQGFRGVAFYTEGARSFYGSKAINSPADLKGMKIRVQPSPSAIRMVELLGGNPTPIAWGELYSALQQGVVDGAENNPTALTTARHGEVAKHFSLDEHTMIPSVVVISNCAYDGLSDDQKKALRQAALESMEAQRVAWNEASDAAIATAKSEMGVEVNTVDKAPFVEAVMPMHAEVAAKSEKLGKLIAEIKAAAN